MKSWYAIKALTASGDPAPRYSISIHDEIGGWGIQARSFIAEFMSIPANAQIDMSVHSPGGDVFEALAMYHVMAPARERITARIEGVVASAATLPLMAASRREAPANTYLMVHNPFMVAMGDSEEMRAVSELLAKVKASMVSIYATGTGKTEDEIAAMMDAETWMNGQEAASAGFVHSVSGATPVMASLNEAARSRFAKVPQALLTTPSAPQEEPEATEAPNPPEAPPAPSAMPADEVAAVCAMSGFATLAAPLISAKASKETVEQRLSIAHEITALACAAGRPGDAAALILAGSTVEAARQCLIVARAASAPVINPHTPSDDERDAAGGSSEAKPIAARLNPNSIYARRQAVNHPA